MLEHKNIGEKFTFFTFFHADHVTDVVSADPLFTVAIRTQPDSPLGPTVSLCYQIHGDRNTSYNLLTTEYTSVNGLWSGITDSLNLLTRIGVQAISITGQCHRILVDLNQCAVTIDGVSHTTDGVHHNSSGVVVTRDDDRVVLIRVPDGERADDDIELEVECERRRMVLESREVEVPMLQLRITRSQNDLPGSAHGFIGLFLATHNTDNVIIVQVYEILATHNTDNYFCLVLA